MTPQLGFAAFGFGELRLLISADDLLAVETLEQLQIGEGEVGIGQTQYGNQMFPLFQIGEEMSAEPTWREASRYCVLVKGAVPFALLCDAFRIFPARVKIPFVQLPAVMRLRESPIEEVALIDGYLHCRLATSDLRRIVGLH